MQKLVVMYYRL